MTSQEFIVDKWGSQGKQVVDICERINAPVMTADEFLNHCFACGGNWVGMLLTGIKALYPEVYDAIPGKMGRYAWDCLCETLVLC